MTFQAKIRIAFDQQLSIDGPMRVVTNRAPFAQRLVFEHKGAGLLAMTLSAVLIQTRHGQAADRSATGATWWLKDIATVGIVALNAIHLPLNDRMMLRQSKFGLRLQMALKTSARIFAGVDNEFTAAASRFDMLAARAVTRFATGLSAIFGLFNVHPGMGTGREDSSNVCVALGAGVIADVCCARNIRRRNYRPSQGRTGNCEKHNQEKCAESRRHVRKFK